MTGAIKDSVRSPRFSASSRWSNLAVQRSAVVLASTEPLAFAGTCVLQTFGMLATRLPLAFCCLLVAALLWAGTALGQPQTAADRDMADRYSRAAEAGDDVAQFYLGALYAAGVGRAQSDTEAFQWIERSAQRGNVQAMLVSGGLMALGKGTPLDYAGAYKWAFIVAEGSQKADMKSSARQLIGMLEPRMTADQIQRAKSDAYQFRAVGTTATTPPAAPAPARIAPTAPAASAPAEARSDSPSPAAGELEKHLPKKDSVEVDKLLKRVPPEYRKRFGL